MKDDIQVPEYPNSHSRFFIYYTFVHLSVAWGYIDGGRGAGE